MTGQIKGFAPIVDEESTNLILGSMPGVQSLQAGEYYAHKQNAFWKILNKIYPEHHLMKYEDKMALLRSNNIALWDVLKTCERKSSLDSDILLKTMEVNDFNVFLNRYSRIKKVCFNGAFAENNYVRFVLKNQQPNQKNNLTSLSYIRLPSTSPAHANLNLDEKFNIWRQALITSSNR